MLYTIIPSESTFVLDALLKIPKYIWNNPIKSSVGFVFFVGSVYGYKIKTEFEKDYLVLPENVEVSWISEKFNQVFSVFGFGNNYFQKVVGTVLRGNKSGDYRNEQYAKLQISNKITESLPQDLKDEFLDKVSFEKVSVNDKTCKFTLDLENINSTLLIAIKESIKFFSNTILDINTLSGEYNLSDTIKGKTLYSLLIPNDGTRVNGKNTADDTKCPVMSWEYDMLYRLNILYKDRLDKDTEYRKMLATSINGFNEFIKRLKILNNIGDFFNNDIDYYNQKSNILSTKLQDALKAIKNDEQDMSIDAMSKLIIQTGNNLQDFIAKNNTSDNVFKHIIVPIMIQRFISEFNLHKNKEGMRLPNIQLNAPYVNKNFWCVLDPNEQNQNIQIAINAGHLENRYYFFSKEERDKVKKIMLEVLEKYIDKNQYNHVKENITESKYVF